MLRKKCLYRGECRTRVVLLDNRLTSRLRLNAFVRHIPGHFTWIAFPPFQARKTLPLFEFQRSWNIHSAAANSWHKTMWNMCTLAHRRCEWWHHTLHSMVAASVWRACRHLTHHLQRCRRNTAAARENMASSLGSRVLLAFPISFTNPPHSSVLLLSPLTPLIYEPSSLLYPPPLSFDSSHLPTLLTPLSSSSLLYPPPLSLDSPPHSQLQALLELKFIFFSVERQSSLIVWEANTLDFYLKYNI